MKLGITTIIAAVLGAQTALADYAIIHTKCSWLLTCDSFFVWAEAFGVSGLHNANEGCRNNPGPPGMTSICFDWNNRRGHFVYANQPKRCIKQEWEKGSSEVGSIRRWGEVPCTW